MITHSVSVHSNWSFVKDTTSTVLLLLRLFFSDFYLPPPPPPPFLSQHAHRLLRFCHARSACCAALSRCSSSSCIHFLNRCFRIARTCFSNRSSSIKAFVFTLASCAIIFFPFCSLTFCRTLRFPARGTAWRIAPDWPLVLRFLSVPSARLVFPSSRDLMSAAGDVLTDSNKLRSCCRAILRDMAKNYSSRSGRQACVCEGQCQGDGTTTDESAPPIPSPAPPPPSGPPIRSTCVYHNPHSLTQS
jgi:hypothetical protein